ncbi:hypothetical protein [Paraburkholderia rhynchosiae]|uniref:Uncharacterized protein n=1 Tax=Paraburkholderia rhynchosiae TaxID=487049 RepID=A0A2N7WKL6_9BURK|nr:hypothetical protein [Paraburkholderia rhynchosiae]PMS29979.1 hypothetical protein C0Z16_16160 [Paraburkholderia rhynchosiae]CAB3694813.1 hypothetical protein LMG27174_03358 [Paraburkholderia rhynchosiae]
MYNDPDLPHVRGHSDHAGFESGDLEGTSAAPARFGRLALCVAAASALAFGVVGTVAYGVWFNSDQQTYAEAIARARQALRMPASGNTAAVLAKSSPEAGSSIATTAPFTTPPSATVATAPIATPAISAAPLATSAINALAERPGIDASARADTPVLLNLPALPAESVASTAEADRKPSVWSGQVTRAPQAEALADNLADATAAAAEPAALLRPMPRATSTPEPAAPQLASTRSVKEARYAQPERRASATSPRRKSNLFARMGSFFRRVSYRQHGSGSQQDLYSHP